MSFNKKSQLPVLAIVVLLAACSPPAAAPPEIVIDQTACAHCSMLISEPRYAAAYRVDGTDKVFDDIACLMSALAVTPDEATPQVWFGDVRDGAWITAEAATFVHAPGLRTPMAGGIVATAHADEVARLASRPEATVYESFEAVRAARGKAGRKKR